MAFYIGIGCGAGLVVGLIVGFLIGRASGAKAAAAAAALSATKAIPKPVLKPPPPPAPAPASVLESTFNAENKPLIDPIAMPGLAEAAALKKEKGARGFLHVIEGPDSGRTALLVDGKDGSVTVGRAKESGLMLSDGGVSQKHAQVRAEAGGWVLKDLGSKNGTFLNDQKVSIVSLHTGDVISFGETKIFVNVS